MIVVQMEAWQHFLLGMRVNGREVLPNLNRLAEGALVWDYIMDVTCRGRTSDAEFAAMTGLYPDCERITGMAYAGNRLVGLPSVLAEVGYGTYSFHGFRKFFWNRSELHSVPSFSKCH